MHSPVTTRIGPLTRQLSPVGHLPLPSALLPPGKLDDRFLDGVRGSLRRPVERRVPRKLRQITANNGGAGVGAGDNQGRGWRKAAGTHFSEDEEVVGEEEEEEAFFGGRGVCSCFACHSG